MLQDLREQVCRANLALAEYGLVIFTWGNVSAIDREAGLVVIKPSGVNYDEMKPEHMTVVDLDGNVAEGDLSPSSDTPTHIEMYKRMPARKMGSIVHTHSQWATVFAQAGLAVPALGTTHADYFYGDIPCTRAMTEEEIARNYEKNTGLVIAEAFADRDPDAIPAILVRGHGSFVWGRDAEESVHNAVVLEYLAMMAYNTIQLNKGAGPIPRALLDKHFLRKHGANAYYGQPGREEKRQ